MIDNRNGLKSHDCKENVLEMIDAALAANRKTDFCTCKYPGNGCGICNYCKIDRGLTVAKACIIASVGRLDVMRSNMVAMQEEIEGKLKAILEE